MGRRARVSREEVLKAAREAFAERGYEGTTLAAIGARLGVSGATVLRHAPTKDALFAACLEAEQSEENLPGAFLNDLRGSEDPIPVLRRFASELVPFIGERMGAAIAASMRHNAGRGISTVKLPFDPRRPSSPPQRVLATLESYLRRAQSAGTLRLLDPRAGAVAFLGAFQAYLFMHRVAQISPPVAFDAYLETVLEIWKRGAVGPGRTSR